MPDRTSPHSPDDPRLLEAALKEAQDAHTLLFTLIEDSLRAEPAADPAAEPAETDPLDAPIRDAMKRADAQLEILRGFIEPWDQRRAAYPAETAGQVDRFLALLEKGLKGLQAQISHRAREVEELRSSIQESLRRLGAQRAGLQGYRQKGDKSRLLNKKI